MQQQFLLLNLAPLKRWESVRSLRTLSKVSSHYFFVIRFESKPDIQPEQHITLHNTFVFKTRFSWNDHCFGLSILQGNDSVFAATAKSDLSSTQMAIKCQLGTVSWICYWLLWQAGNPQWLERERKSHAKPNFYWCCPSLHWSGGFFPSPDLLRMMPLCLLERNPNL